MSKAPIPPFFTSAINKEFIERFKQPQIPPQVQTQLRINVPAIWEYQVLTLFEFLEKLDNRTTRSTRRTQQQLDAHYQDVKVKNRTKMKEFMAQYLCRGKIGLRYGVQAVERALKHDDYDVLIITNKEIEEDVDLEYGDSQESVTSNFDSQPPDQRLLDLADEMTFPAVAVPDQDDSQGPDDSQDPDDSPGPDDSQDPDDSPGPDDSRQTGMYEDIDLEDDEDSDDSEGSYDSESSYDSEGSDAHAPLFRPESTGKGRHADLRKWKKQKDDSKAIREKKMRSVVGFLIVQRGECESFPDDYAVNLICVKDDAVAGTGPLLIGLYLYTILERVRTNGHLQLGLLELAGGYYNIAGLCLYSKFGFAPEIRMATHGCFPHPGNMPMSLHFPSKYRVGPIDTIQKLDNAKDIVCNIFAGEKYHPGFKLPICKVRTNQFALIALREYNRLIDYRKPYPYPNIGIDSFTAMCSNKPELDLINSQIGTAFEIKIYNTLVPGLIDDMESFPPVTLNKHDLEFIRIITSVGPNVPRSKIRMRYIQARKDYNKLCVEMFGPQSAGHTPGRANKKTRRKKKTNKKTTRRTK